MCTRLSSIIPNFQSIHYDVCILCVCINNKHIDTCIIIIFYINWHKISSVVLISLIIITDGRGRVKHHAGIYLFISVKLITVTR